MRRRKRNPGHVPSQEPRRMAKVPLMLMMMTTVTKEILFKKNLKKDVQKEEDFVKVVLLGPSRAGKSLLLQSVQRKSLEDVQLTMFVRTQLVSGYIGTKLYTLKFWDVPGDIRNKAISSVYCTNTNCVFFVFDFTDQKSFEQLKDWVLDTKMKVTSSTKLFLIGNKYNENENEVSVIDAMAFAKKERLKFVTFNVLKEPFEFRLFCWKLMFSSKKLNFL